MKISYIIPVYNVPEDMLMACVISIKAAYEKGMETVFDYEIIIVDDGSDEPVKASFFPEIPDSRVLGLPDLQIIRQENQGLSAARNTGIAAATGDYIQFIDGDDMLIPEQYAHILYILQGEKPDLLNFAFEVDDRQLKQPKMLRTLRLPKLLKTKTTGPAYLQTNNLRVAAWSYVFKRELLGQVQSAECRVQGQQSILLFEKDLKNEDERFTPQLYLRAKTVVATDIKAYFYRQREGSLQHSYSQKFVKRRMKDILSTIDFLRDLGEPALERRINQMSMEYIYNSIMLTGKGDFIPLPHRRYTFKYWLFSYIVGNKAGQWLLKKLLPRLPKED